MCKTCNTMTSDADYAKQLSPTMDADSKLGFVDGGRRIGRVVRKALIDQNLPDKRIEAITDILIEEFWAIEGNFEISPNVVKTYVRSYGGTSCMTGDEAEFMQWLEDNSVKILKYSYGDVEARALVWESRCGETLIDRIYPNSGRHVSQIHRWGWQHGYLTRKGNSLPSGKTEFIDATGKTRGPFAVDLDDSDNGLYPYLDSFTTGDETRLGWRLFTDGRGDTCFNDTGGGHSEDERSTCEGCEDRIDDDDVRPSECGTVYCSDCYHARYTDCADCSCEVSDEDLRTDYAGDSVCESCFDGSTCGCDFCGENVQAGTTIFIENEGMEVCQNCIENNFYSFMGEHIRQCDLKAELEKLDGVIVCRKTVLIHWDALTVSDACHYLTPANGEWYSCPLDIDALEYCLN